MHIARVPGLRAQSAAGLGCSVIEQIRKAVPSHAALWKMIYGGGGGRVLRSASNFFNTCDGTFKS